MQAKDFIPDGIKELLHIYHRHTLKLHKLWSVISV
jgi:hypothetical protein